MAREPFDFPFAGRRDDSAYHDQPQLTTPSARNVRARDPVTGRITGARRSALTKWNETQIGNGPIRALVSTAIDDRKTLYSFSSGTVDDAWSAVTPSKTSCENGKVDTQGNVYALDGGAGVVKYNSAGLEIMRLTLPVLDPAHVVRALWVDEALRIFAAVSEGGDPRTAAMFCVLQLQDNQSFVLWTHQPGGYTEDLRVFNGSQLYAAHNYPTENRGRVVIYEGLGLTPFEAKRIEDGVAYPITSMDVGPDGAVYCASKDNLGDARTGVVAGIEQYRPGHPSMKGFHPPITAWTPTQLDSSHTRIHAWYDAADLDTTDLDQSDRTEVTLDEGQQILRWRDKSGNNRHWYAGSLFDDEEAGPTYSKVGPGGLPAVRFTNVGTTKQSMVTFPNASIAAGQADQQRTAIPAHEGAMWALLILMRPVVDDVVATDPRVVFYAENDATVGTPGPHGLWVNRDCGAVQPGTFSKGRVSYFAKTDAADDGGCVAADQASVVSHHDANSRFTDCCLVTIIWDGGVDSAGGTTKTRCVVRLNGRPIDRFTGLAFHSLKPNYLAYAPTVAAAVANRLNGEICEIVSIGRRDRLDATTEPKVLTHDLVDFTEDFPAGQAQTDHELARLESYMLHRRGLGHLLGGLPTAPGPGNLWPHFYGPDDPGGTGPFGVTSPPDYIAGGRSTALEQVLMRFPLTTKHDAVGKLLWTCNENTHPDTGADRGGIGFGVVARKVESDGLTHVWLTGTDAVQATTGDVAVRKIIDLGATFSGAQADGAWRNKFTGNATPGYETPKMAADEFGNLFYPGHNLGAGTIRPLHVFQKDPDGSGNAVQLAEMLFTAPANLAYAVALPPSNLTPDYRTDLATKVAERCYVFTQAGDGVIDPAESVFAVRMVTVAALATGSPRTLTTLAIVEDDIKLVTATTITVPTGGSAAVDASAQFIQAFRAGDDIVILDGTRYLAYNLRDGTLAALESTSAGEIPPRGKLGMYWRHRLLIGNFADAPGNYAASKLGDIRNWNQRPGALATGEQIQTSTQAFSGTTTRAGEAEDSLVAMVPIQDDLAFFICESRILRLTGDPQDGGNIHKVTDSMGGVFGDSVCTDSRGRAFMFGNKPPGLYQIRLEGDPIPLSAHTLEESEFSDIDFSTHRIILAWNPIDRGIHVFQVAWGTSTLVNHWFWEEKTHRLVTQPPLWTDRFYAAGKQPTAVTYLGGDDTRVLLFGCADGYIRKWDPSAPTDDGDPVDGFFTMKVSPPGGPHMEWHLQGIQVALASGQGGARVEVFASEVADELGPIQDAFPIGPGLNDEQGVSHRAEHLFVRVRSAAAERWAFESAMVDIEPAGDAVGG